MSQILTLTLDLELTQIEAALKAAGIQSQQSQGRRLLLPVSAECIPEPVDILCPAGTANTLEPWGFRVAQGQVTLVCGEFDRDVLTQGFVNPIRQQLAKTQLRESIDALQAESKLEPGQALITIGAPQDE